MSVYDKIKKAAGEKLKWFTGNTTEMDPKKAGRIAELADNSYTGPTEYVDPSRAARIVEKAEKAEKEIAATRAMKNMKQNSL